MYLQQTQRCQNSFYIQINEPIDQSNFFLFHKWKNIMDYARGQWLKV